MIRKQNESKKSFIMNRNLYLPGYQFCPHCEYAGAFSGFQRAAHYMIMTLAVVMFGKIYKIYDRTPKTKLAFSFLKKNHFDIS